MGAYYEMMPSVRLSVRPVQVHEVQNGSSWKLQIWSSVFSINEKENENEDKTITKLKRLLHMTLCGFNSRRYELLMSAVLLVYAT